MIHHFGNAHSISPVAQVKTDAHVNACMHACKKKKKSLGFQSLSQAWNNKTPTTTSYGDNGYPIVVMMGDT